MWDLVVASTSSTVKIWVPCSPQPRRARTPWLASNAPHVKMSHTYLLNEDIGPRDFLPQCSKYICDSVDGRRYSEISWLGRCGAARGTELCSPKEGRENGVHRSHERQNWPERFLANQSYLANDAWASSVGAPRRRNAFTQPR